jgi:hypothetical protein
MEHAVEDCTASSQRLVLEGFSPLYRRLGLQEVISTPAANCGRITGHSETDPSAACVILGFSSA